MAAAPPPQNTTRHLFDSLADDLNGVQERGAADHGGAMLVVVKNRDFEPFLELLFDVEALGSLDVLEVDAAKGGLQHLACRGSRRQDFWH